MLKGRLGGGYPTWFEDGNLVMGNLLNAAQAVGAGSCCIYRAKEIFEKPEGRQKMRKWGLPESFIAIGHCILGYAAEGGTEPAGPRRKNYIIYA